MATANQNPQLPSKSSRLPEEILYQTFNVNSQGSCLTRQMKNYEFQVAKANLEDRVAQFQFLFDRSLKDFPRSNEAELRAMFERKCVELIRNACSTEFLNDHGRELAEISTFKKALELLAGLVGVESEEERKQNAAIDLENLDRKIEESEKFSSLLKRIRTLAGLVDNRSDVINFMAEQKFKKCIEPKNWTFLMDHCQTQASPEAMASFLDDRHRYKFVKVAATEAFDVRAFMDQQSELLRTLIKEDRKEMASVNQGFASALETLTATVNEIKLDRARAQNPPIFENSAQGRPQTFAPNHGPGNFGQQFQGQNRGFQPGNQSEQFGQQMMPRHQRPLFCGQCGRSGHIKRRCREVQCHKCKGFGHVQADCNKPDTLAGAQIRDVARSFQNQGSRQGQERWPPVPPQFSGN